MDNSKTACICILDVESKFNQSYYSWFYSILRKTEYFDSFDVYVCSINEAAFLESNLYSMLEELRKLGVIKRISTIQFNVHSNEKLYEMATLCENFREYNQFLFDISAYVWYFQITPVVDFDLNLVNKFKSLEGVKLMPNKVYYLTNNTYHDLQPFSFLMTSNRFVFNNLQNIFSFINSNRIKANIMEQEPSYFIKRLLQRMNCEYAALEDLK